MYLEGMYSFYVGYYGFFNIRIKLLYPVLKLLPDGREGELPYLELYLLEGKTIQMQSSILKDQSSLPNVY